MSFDEVSFPLALASGSRGGPEFLTEIVTIQGGFERRNQCWSQARRRFDARSGVVTALDASVLMAFFMARGGRARGFRLKDWGDYSSAADGKATPAWHDQLIGTGNGTQTQFQLIKKYGNAAVSYERAIRKPVAGSVRIGVDGAEYTTGWSVDETTGIVTFAQAPAIGAPIYAGFLFDVPVRFDADRLDVTAQDKNAGSSEIPLLEVRV